ncbi:MAG: hypothetical protein ABSA08_02630, partial [Acidimicrobiales bacterium]
LHGGGPLAVRVTWWSPEHLPEGRRQAGDRHLKFHDERDNLPAHPAQFQQTSTKTLGYLTQSEKRAELVVSTV